MHVRARRWVGGGRRARSAGGPDRGQRDLAYPAYGQSLPPFELRDPIAGITIDSEAINRTAIVTGIFTFCPAGAGSSSDGSSGCNAASPTRD